MPSRENVNTIIAFANLAIAIATVWKLDRILRTVRREYAIEAYEIGRDTGRDKDSE